MRGGRLGEARERISAPPADHERERESNSVGRASESRVTAV
jgi:hypothetical protein